MLGVPLEFRIEAYGAEPDGYGATGLPAGLSVNPNTGFITGTPSQAGQSFVTLTATNDGGTGSVVSRLIIHPAGPASITSLELLPASGSATAGRSTRLTLLVRNTSTEPQTLPVIFSSSDPAVPAPGQRSDTLALRAFMLEVPGKRSASEESAVSRHRISFYVASTASGPLQITAYGSATLKSTSSLNIRPARRQ